MPKKSGSKHDRKGESSKQDRIKSLYFDENIRDKKTNYLYSVRIDQLRVWVKAREVLHEAIEGAILNKGISVNNPFALFMGGGSASGKSLIRDEIILPWINEPVVMSSRKEVRTMRKRINKYLPNFVRGSKKD